MGLAQDQPAQPSSRRASTSKKGRKFFDKVEPTFAIKPSATQLEFVDNSDPSKDLVVRKKAREWVYRNREVSARRKQPPGSHTFRADDADNKQRDSKSRAGLKTSSRALVDPSSGRIDPFDALPNIGRNFDHIIEFYHETSFLRIHFLTLSIVLTRSPEKLLYTDEKDLARARRSALSTPNSVMGTMAAERVSFVIWLYATTVIRDGMAGNWDSEECRYYYRLSLQTMREESQRSVAEFTDSFIAALACFSATANFAGQYKAAEMHRNAMIQAITMKGHGNLIRGLRKCKVWTQKAAVWCEIHVAAQIPSPPQLPYMPPPQNDPLPYTIIAEAERLTKITLSCLPPVSDPFPEIVQQLHVLSVSQTSPPSSFGVWPAHHNIDPAAVRPLYCAEYTLLCILSEQQKEGHQFTPFEVMFTEACQIYTWGAVRGLPPQMKMCDLFVERLKKALEPLLRTSQHVVAGMPPTTTKEFSYGLGATDTAQESTVTRNYPPVLSKPLDSVFQWALFLGMIVSSVGARPEHGWFKNQLLHQLLIENADQFKSNEDLKCVLKMFPYTEAFCGIGVAKLNIPF